VEEEGGGERTCMDSLRTVRVSSTQSYTILVYMVFDKAPEHVAVFVFFWLSFITSRDFGCERFDIKDGGGRRIQVL
jgi:hypothetical protein